jgi:hypothetical protein
MRRLTAAALIFGLAMSALASAQQPPTKPKELDNLSQYVGNWTSDVTNRLLGNQNGTKLRTVNQAELILDGWFLQNIDVNRVVDNPEQVSKSLSLWTYDARSEKYITWVFHNTGEVAELKGQWNPTGKAFLLELSDPPPTTTGQMTEQFLDLGTISGGLKIIGNDGKTLMDMAWTRKRQAGVAGKPTREQWEEIGTPIQPLASPQGSTAKGRMTAKWVLDGRFLLGTSEVGNHRSLWVIGYDTTKAAFRYVRFTNAGQIDDSIGQWNEETRSFAWKVVNERPGITRTSTNRIIGKDSVQAHIVAEDKAGEVQLDLTIKSTRRK